MQLHRIHHLVVMRGREVVGVVSDRDLGGERGAHVRANRKLGDLMTPDVSCATPSTTVRRAANLMRGQAIGCLPVMDENKLVGIVTHTDLLELLGRGAERPVAESRRWVMKGRGPRRKPHKQR